MSDLIELTDRPEVSILDFNMAKNMAEILHEAYPGHLWAVTCEGEKGIATVRNMMLSGQWGFVLKLSDLFSSSDMKKQVVMAGGELLERYRLRRGAANQDILAAMPTDFAGRSIGDKS